MFTGLSVQMEAHYLQAKPAEACNPVMPRETLQTSFQPVKRVFAVKDCSLSCKFRQRNKSLPFKR